MASGSQVLRENLTACSYHHQGTDTGFFLVWDAPIRNDFNLVSCLFIFLGEYSLLQKAVGQLRGWGWGGWGCAPGLSFGTAQVA